MPWAAAQSVAKEAEGGHPSPGFGGDTTCQAGRGQCQALWDHGRRKWGTHSRRPGGPAPAVTWPKEVATRPSLLQGLFVSSASHPRPPPLPLPGHWAVWPAP